MRLFDAGTREGVPAVVHDKVVTAANAITAMRLLGLPLFVYLMVGPAAYGLAFATLVVVGTTDWIDGYVARRFDQVTKLGKLMDPLIDRLLLAVAAITLLSLGFIPWWVVALVIGRDVALLGAAAVVLRKLAIPPVSRLGKFATACLLIGVPGFLLGRMEWSGAQFSQALAWGVTTVGIATYYAAGVHYARAAKVALKQPRNQD